MRYVMFMIPAVYSTGEDPQPSAEAVAQMMEYNQALSAAGVLVSLDGFHPPQTGSQWAFAEDGPRESEIAASGAVGGMWILQVDSDEEASQWARQCPAMPGDVIQIRRIAEISDYDEDVQQVLGDYDI